MSDKRLTNTVMYDGLYTFVLRLFNIGCAAGLGVLTARLLGPAGKGVYALPGIEAGLLAAAFSGLNSGTSYFLLNRRPGRALIAPILWTALIFTLAGAAALIPVTLFSGMRWTAMPAMLSLPAVAALNIAMGYAIGIKRVRYSTTLQVAVTVLTLALMLGGLYLVARTPAVAIAAWLIANALVSFLALGAVIFHCRKTVESNDVSTGEYLRFALKIGGVNLIALLNYRADLYIVAILASPALLGMYTVGVSAAESLLVPTQVAALVTSPYIGGLEVKAAGSLAARCVRNNFVIALLVCGTLFIVSRPLIELLYGAAFEPVVPAFRVLLVGVLALSLGSPISSFFTLKLGRPEVALWLASLSAAVCIGTAVALVPTAGLLGAAIGSTAGYVLGQIAAIAYFSRCASIALHEILLPTSADFALFMGFAVRVYRDGLRLLRIQST